MSKSTRLTDKKLIELLTKEVMILSEQMDRIKNIIGITDDHTDKTTKPATFYENSQG